MFIANGGNVGIGTTNPALNLHVRALSGNAGVQIDSAGATAYPHIRLANAGDPKWDFGSDVLNGTDNFYIYSFKKTSGADRVFSISKEGNVGIGTRFPGAKLSFQDLTTDNIDGLTWYNPSPTVYGIHRTTGPWVAPAYQQLRIGWATGIVLDPGSQFGFTKSYVDVQGDLQVSGSAKFSGAVDIDTSLVNMLPYSRFELWPAGPSSNPAGWGLLGGSSSVSRVAGDQTQFAVRLESTGPNQVFIGPNILPKVKALAGESITLLIRARRISGTGGWPNSLSIMENGSPWSNLVWISPASFGSDWTTVTARGVVPAGLSNVAVGPRFRLEAGNIIEIDWVNLIIGDLAPGHYVPHVVQSEGSDGGLIVNSGNVEVKGGYVQLDLTGGGAPPSADCDEAAERGRMKVDSGAGLLYVCVDSGWVSK